MRIQELPVSHVTKTEDCTVPIGMKGFSFILRMNFCLVVSGGGGGTHDGGPLSFLPSAITRETEHALVSPGYSILGMRRVTMALRRFGTQLTARCNDFHAFPDVYRHLALSYM